MAATSTDALGAHDAAPVNPAESRQLLKRLSTVVQAGAAPSFADAGARSGYIRRRMEHRSAQVAIFLQHPHMHLALSSLLNAQDSSPYTVASIGGAGGSDAVGLILCRNGLAVHRDGAGAPLAAAPARRPVRVWVYDLEEGWSDAVQAVTRSLQRVGVECAGDAVGFSTCDCTHSLTHASNTHLARHAVDLDLVVFSFVLAENALALQVLVAVEIDRTAVSCAHSRRMQHALRWSSPPCHVYAAAWPTQSAPGASALLTAVCLLAKWPTWAGRWVFVSGRTVAGSQALGFRAHTRLYLQTVSRNRVRGVDAWMAGDAASVAGGHQWPLQECHGAQTWCLDEHAWNVKIAVARFQAVRGRDLSLGVVGCGFSITGNRSAWHYILASL